MCKIGSWGSILLFACQTLMPAFIFRVAPAGRSSQGRWFINKLMSPEYLLTITEIGEGEGTFGGDPEIIFKNLFFF